MWATSDMRTLRLPLKGIVSSHFSPEGRKRITPTRPLTVMIA